MTENALSFLAALADPVSRSSISLLEVVRSCLPAMLAENTLLLIYTDSMPVQTYQVCFPVQRLAHCTPVSLDGASVYPDHLYSMT